MVRIKCCSYNSSRTIFSCTSQIRTRMFDISVFIIGLHLLLLYLASYYNIETELWKSCLVYLCVSFWFHFFIFILCSLLFTILSGVDDRAIKVEPRIYHRICSGYSLNVPRPCLLSAILIDIYEHFHRLLVNRSAKKDLIYVQWFHSYDYRQQSFSQTKLYYNVA